MKQFVAVESRRDNPPTNLDVVKAAFDAYYRGDMEGLAHLADPNLVVSQAVETPEAETFYGPKGLIEAIESWAGEWDDLRVERIRTREVADQVLTTVRQRVRGKGSGIEVEGEFTFVFTVNKGKLVRWQMFRHEEEALEAVGLRRDASVVS